MFEFIIFALLVVVLIAWATTSGRVKRIESELADLRERIAKIRLDDALRAVQTPQQRPTTTVPEAPLQPSPPRPTSAPLPEKPVEAPIVPASAAMGAGVATSPKPPAARMPEPFIVNHEPNQADLLLARLKGWLFQGNVPVKIGLLVLFFGVAAALKYAVDQNYLVFPIEFRLAAIAAAGGIALLIGFRQRSDKPVFALSMQGGGLGILLLTIFAAYRLYHLLTPGLAFALIVFIVAGAVLLALLQNAAALAVLGFLGGYLAPVLISTGSGNHVALFSYYAVLNLAVFALAWFKPWRALNLLGFAFTFVVGLAWGKRYYQPEFFGSVEPFLIGFFLFYVAIGVLYALRQKQNLVDGTLVFGTPLLAFGLQCGLLRGDPMALAYSAIAVALLYAVLATWLIRKKSMPLFGQAGGALAIGFATLAIPLALSDRWTMIAWAAEGAGLIWLGLRQNHRLMQVAGWVLQIACFIIYWASIFKYGWAAETGELLIINGHFLNVTLMVLAALFSSWIYEQHANRRRVVWPWFFYGWALWVIALWREFVVNAPEHVRAPIFIGMIAFTLAIVAIARHSIPWPRLSWPALACFLLALLSSSVFYLRWQEVMARADWLAWLTFVLAAWLALHRLKMPQARGISVMHIAALLTIAVLLGHESHVRGAMQLQLASGWNFMTYLAPLALILFATWRWRWATQPCPELFPHYRMRWLATVGAIVGLGFGLSLYQSGDAAPLSYIPLLNPLELCQLVVVVFAWMLLRRMPDGARLSQAAMPWIILLFVTVATLRAVHQLHGEAWRLPELMASQTVQTALTVVWSVFGVTSWIYGSARRQYKTWLAGALVMGAVLIKLLLVDRHATGNLEGIISFLAVGILMIVIGYFAPSPPRKPAVTSS